MYSGPPLDSIRALVASEFQVKDVFLDPSGIPTILVTAEPPKKKFMNLLGRLAAHNLIAAVRGTADTLTIKVFQKPQLKPSRQKINILLFVATVVTVLYAGYVVWVGGLFGPDPLRTQLNSIIAPGRSVILEAGLFSLGLLGIIGLHEFGHKAITVHHDLDATYPYFVPGPPPIGTFGALISLRGPPVNRDQLFDLGLSGPAVGFVVTLVVALLSFIFGTTYAPISHQLDNWISTCLPQRGAEACLVGSDYFGRTPFLLILIQQFMNQVSAPVLPEQQLFFAANIGALLTFLNIVPAWQLDGGHISRAVFGPFGHRMATIAGLLLLSYSGYYTFALLVLVMMGFSRRGFAGVEPLDDVSSLSNLRKVLYLVAMAMLVLTFSRIPLPF